MTGSNLAIKENTAIDYADSLGYLRVIPNDYWNDTEHRDSSEYVVEKLEEQNQKIQNLYDTINQTLDFIRFFLYKKSEDTEIGIVDKLVETAKYLFPDYRNMTKDELLNEKKYELKNFEIIDI